MIIFDLDGTLADCEHRRHFVQRPALYGATACLDPVNGEIFTRDLWKPDWKSFYEACDKDEPNLSVIEIFHNLHAQEQDVQIWSGRCETTREKTYQWLLDNANLKYLTRFYTIEHLKMRPIGDNTPDDKLKEKWLDEAIAQGKTIDFVFDDRPKVIRMWRRRGIFVFNCCQHDREF